MPKLHVGQKLFIKPIGNAARYSKEIQEAEIKFIGKKYFTLKGNEWRGDRFLIDGMYNDGRGYISDYVCYESMQEILDEKEETELKKKMQKIFDWSSSVKFTLDQLRRINAIVMEDK